jgi:hypothetical protein
MLLFLEPEGIYSRIQGREFKSLPAHRTIIICLRKFFCVFSSYCLCLFWVLFFVLLLFCALFKVWFTWFLMLFCVVYYVLLGGFMVLLG